MNEQIINDNEFKIYGTKGSIKIYANFWGATKASLFLPGETITVTKPVKVNGFEYQIEEVVKCIIKRKVLLCRLSNL